MQINSKTLDFKWGMAFLAVALIYMLIAFISNNFIFTETYYYNSLSDRLDSERIHEIFSVNRKFQWVAYLIQPGILLLKLSIIAGVIYAGIILFNHTVEFKTVFKITILAETIMALAGIVKTTWFLINGANSLASVKSFYPFSIVNILNVSKIPAYLLYPLQQLNLFELGYWLFFAFALRAVLKNTYKRSFSILASSYGVSFLIWIMAIVFIQIQYS